MEMKLFGTIALMAVVASLGIDTAAIARDTRPEGPRIEDNDRSDGSGERVNDVKPYLPGGTAGMSCAVMDKEGLWVSVKNETGVDIPAGATVTYFVQPGDIQRTYILAKPWKAGKVIEVVLDSEGVPMPAECTIKIKAGRNQPEIGESVGFKPGDTDAFDPAVKPQPKYEFSCDLGQEGVVVTNTGQTTIFAGSFVSMYVPDVYFGFYVEKDIPPGGSAFNDMGSLPGMVRHGVMCEPDGIRLP
jgi:hypothetical protein